VVERVYICPPTRKVPLGKPAAEADVALPFS
jgi:hypothetical protein